MTPEEKSQLLVMQESAVDRYRSEYTNRIEEIGAIRAYASCCIALHLDRIATALERPAPNYDPHVSTALNRIVEITEEIESVISRG